MTRAEVEAFLARHKLSFESRSARTLAQARRHLRHEVLRSRYPPASRCRVAVSNVLRMLRMIAG